MPISTAVNWNIAAKSTWKEGVVTDFFSEVIYWRPNQNKVSGQPFRMRVRGATLIGTSQLYKIDRSLMDPKTHYTPFNENKFPSRKIYNVLNEN